MLNVLVACKEPKPPGGLEYIPGTQGVNWCLWANSNPPWGEAANALLDIADREGADALFLDDDVTLTAETFAALPELLDRADVFGFDLHALDGQRQVGARHILTSAPALVDWVQPGPAYVAHVSTSAVYIKHRVLAAGGRFPIWSGLHWEDVAFCFDAWMHGFQVLAIPGRVDHAIMGSAGATKGQDPQFWEKWRENATAFQAWCSERDLSSVPRGAQPL